MGDVLRRCPNVTALALVREFSANVDEGGNPQNAYFERARPCYSSVGRTPTWATLEHPRRAGGRCACCPRGRPPRHRDSGRGAADHGREDGLGLARGRHAAAGAPSPLISPDLPGLKTPRRRGAGAALQPSPPSPRTRRAPRHQDRLLPGRPGCRASFTRSRAPRSGSACSGSSTRGGRLPACRACTRRSASSTETASRSSSGRRRASGRARPKRRAPHEPGCRTTLAPTTRLTVDFLIKTWRQVMSAIASQRRLGALCGKAIGSTSRLGFASTL